MAEKLNPGQKHMLQLVVKGADADGWAPVSAPVMKIIKLVPSELVTIENVGDEGRGRARLTATGESLLAAMEWL
jgi:hypothetical protein